ncbi:hypothetical protein L7F22_010444 [Adiantum nelumboides]|nr:hypothetical protein [Adiantum nelumboides]
MGINKNAPNLIFQRHQPSTANLFILLRQVWAPFQACLPLLHRPQQRQRAPSISLGAQQRYLLPEIGAAQGQEDPGDGRRGSQYPPNDDILPRSGKEEGSLPPMQRAVGEHGCLLHVSGEDKGRLPPTKRAEEKGTFLPDGRGVLGANEDQHLDDQKSLLLTVFYEDIVEGFNHKNGEHADDIKGEIERIDHAEEAAADEDASLTMISSLICSLHTHYPHHISFLDFQKAFTEVTVNIAAIADEEDVTDSTFSEFPFLSLRGEYDVNPFQVQEMETTPKVKMKKKLHLKSRARAA